MEPIVLYGNTPLTSPYVMTAFVALEEKGLPFSFEYLALGKSEQLAPGYAKASVTNRVPSLVQGDFWLSESSAICEYLEEAFPPPKYARLYPADLKERARVRMVQALIRSDFMAIREERSTETVFQGAPKEALSLVASAQVERLYRIASELLPDGKASIASTFSIADVDLSTMLQRLAHNGDPIPAPLASYVRTTWQRPSIQKWLTHTRYVAR
jgi:glutathione S-transferase